MAMEAAMRSAWMKAGLKMGLGFFVVAAVLGIRVVSVDKLEDSSASPGDGPVVDARPVDDIRAHQVEAVVNEEESTTGGVMAGIREALPGSGTAEPRPGDRMVSCRIRGTTQFMTADDCGVRGGRSTLFESDR